MIQISPLIMIQIWPSQYLHFCFNAEATTYAVYFHGVEWLFFDKFSDKKERMWNILLNY